MHGIDEARHRGAVAVDRGDDIVQLVRGRVEALERPAAVRPLVGGHRRDERSDRAIVDGNLVGEKRAIGAPVARIERRSEEHTSELQSLMRISYAVFCLKKKTKNHDQTESQ